MQKTAAFSGGCRYRPRMSLALASKSGSGLADRKSTRLNSSHGYISDAGFCLKKKDISKENDGRAGERSAPSGWLKRMPVLRHLRRRNEIEKSADEENQHHDLHHHHHGVELS